MRGYYVFGLIDEVTKKAYFEIVPDRKQEALFPIIQSKELPFSTIITNEFANYTHCPSIIIIRRHWV